MKDVCLTILKVIGIILLIPVAAVLAFPCLICAALGCLE